MDFHARFSASGKIYEYRIVNAPSSRLSLPLRMARLAPARAHQNARGILRARRHPRLRAFQGSGSVVTSTRRTVRSIQWAEGCGSDLPLVMRIEGDGFLRHMVRNIVGTLVDVGRGRWPAGEVAAILAAGDRARAGRTAPAQGLFLSRVLY